MLAIEVHELTRNYNGLCAVDKISFEVDQGEIFGYLGPNGAGKTTLFNLISGMLNPTTGRIFFLGKDITKMSPHRRVALGLARTYRRAGDRKSAIEQYRRVLELDRRHTQAKKELRDLLVDEKS